MGFLSSLTEQLKDSIGETIGLLKDQEPDTLPIQPPLSSTKSILPEQCEFFVQEKQISTSGEDYDIYFDEDKPYLKVRGSTLSHIPGIDEIKIYEFEDDASEEDEPKQIAKLKRKNDAIVISRDTEKFFDSKKIAWIYQIDDEEFNVYSDEDKENLIYKFEGDFIGRDIVMKNANNDEPVAKIDERTFTESNIMNCAAGVTGYDDVANTVGLDDVQSYDVKVAKGMDVVFALICTVAIDEQFDEVREAKRKEREEK